MRPRSMYKKGDRQAIFHQMADHLVQQVIISFYRLPNDHFLFSHPVEQQVGHQQVQNSPRKKFLIMRS